MNIIDLATKTMQTAIKTAVDGVKSVVDTIKATTDATRTVVTSTSTKVDSIDTKVGTLLDGRVVKSVQRGTALINGAKLDVNVSQVNTTKSFLLVHGFYTTSGSTTGATSHAIRGQISNSTQLNFATDYAISGRVNWELVEFY